MNKLNLNILLLLLFGCDSSTIQARNFDCNVDKEYSIQDLKKCSEQNNIVRQYDLGISYLEGKKIPQDMKQAFYWINKSANQGFSGSQNMMSWFYRTGTVVEKDDKKAFEWAVKAAESGSRKSLNNVGFYYQQGIGVERDLKKGLEYYLKAAELGNLDAHVNLGYAYLNGWGVERNLEQALNWMLEPARKGNVNAIVNVGLIYQDLDNLKEAEEWLRNAAEFNHPVAQAHLICLLAKKTDQETKEEAKKWLDTIQETNPAIAFYVLGKLHSEKNKLFPNNEYQASEYYLKGAEMGDAGSQYEIAQRLINGHFIPKNELAALRWYESAAENGIQDANIRLVEIYSKGTSEIPKNKTKKQYWQSKLPQ